MNKDDIKQKLALLPEGIAEANRQSWEKVVSFYKHQTAHPSDIPQKSFYNKALLSIHNLVKDLSNAETAKLFRSGTSVNDLMISTADKHGLRVGDPLVRVTFSGGYIIIQYEISSPITMDENPNIIKKISCDPNENLMVTLQPLLDILWDETRGNKMLEK
jgi:hypothetical protein